MAAMADAATAMAILPWERAQAKMLLKTNVLPVPPGASMK
jgi:hypothetical protein